MNDRSPGWIMTPSYFLDLFHRISNQFNDALGWVLLGLGEERSIRVEYARVRPVYVPG